MAKLRAVRRVAAVLLTVGDEQVLRAQRRRAKRIHGGRHGPIALPRRASAHARRDALASMEGLVAGRYRQRSRAVTTPRTTAPHRAAATGQHGPRRAASPPGRLRRLTGCSSTPIPATAARWLLRLNMGDYLAERPVPRVFALERVAASTLGGFGSGEVHGQTRWLVASLLWLPAGHVNRAGGSRAAGERRPP
jgi:hypothetical protein